MLFIILLLEGFITISVEILTIRQLLPFFGGSVVITSIIIGVFLLFLALGYWRGGSYRENFVKQLSHNFILSILWIGIGLSYSLISVFYFVCIHKAQLPFLLSLSLYLFIVLAPVVYWLGQTIPLTTNLFSQQHHVSRISGRALFLSTMGSFLGALLTSLLLFQYLGVAWTVVINCILLFALVMLLRTESGLSLLTVFILSLALVLIILFNIDDERRLFKRTNNYANYQVIQLPAASKLLQMNASNSSLLTIDKKGFPYIEYIRDLLFNQLNYRHKQLLILGAGGFSLTAAGTHDNNVTYVDIDPDIQTLSETYFLEHPIHGQFIAEDARSYLRKNQTKFDVIISDVYSNQTAVPASLLTLEYFQSIEEHLNPAGLMILNMIVSPSFDDVYSRVVFNTIHAVFPYCAVVPLSWKYSSTNIIYICPKINPSHAIYRDDLTTATLDFFNSRQVERQ